MKRGIEITDIYRIKMLSQVCASKKGDRYAAVITEIRKEQQDYRSIIRIWKEDGQTSDICKGTVSKAPSFSPDGRLLYFLSDESGTMQLWKYDIRTESCTQLTTHRYGILQYVISGDGQSGYAVAESDASLEDGAMLFREKTEAEKEKEKADAQNHAVHIKDIVHKWDGSGYLTGRKTHIFCIKLSSGAMAQLTKGEHNFRDVAVSGSGELLTFVSDPVTDADIRPIHIHLWTYDLKNNRQNLLIDGALQVERPCFVNGDRAILFCGMDGKFGWETINRLWLYDLEKGVPVCLTPESDFDFSATDLSDMKTGSDQSFRYDSQENSVYFMASWYGNTHLYKADIHGHVEEILHGERVIQGFSFSEDSKTIYFVASQPDFPEKLYRYSLESGEEELLFDPNQSFFEEAEATVPESFTVTSFDGLTMHGWIQKPLNFDPEKKYKMVLEIHGGPGCMYANQFMHEFQVLTSHDYVVAFFNPRGSSGYGQKYQSLIQRRYGGNGGGDYEDLMLAVDELAQLPYIDENRMYVTGGSYGGFMTNWIVGHTNRFRAAVAQRSITNWSSFIGSSDYGFCEAELGHQCDYFEEEFELKRVSPVTYARNVCTPLMLLHSDKDYRCPLEQAEQFFTILKLLGKTVEMKIFPGQSHGMSRGGRPVLREERLQTIVDWFERFGGQENG